jgi:branched-subunit amino acid transport protein
MIITHQFSKRLESLAPYKIAPGFLVAGLSFVTMGTITTIWQNPLFTRMTPIAGWELPYLLIFASLAGVFTAIHQPSCSTKKAGIGSVASFLGIACPTCNKVLMLIFGSEALLRWFDPLRPWLAAVGFVLLCLAIRTEWRKHRNIFSTIGEN